MRRALVTGASGFIGWHLAKSLLADNVEVVGLVRESSRTERLAALGVELRVGSLSDLQGLQAAVADCDAVFHLAGLTRALSSEALMRVNVRGTAELARVCVAQPFPPIFLHMSSLAAAGPTHHDKPLVESDPPKPVSDYGRSKLASEAALQQFAGDMPITIVRPPIVFGQGDPGMLVMFKALQRTHIHVIPGYRRKLFSVIHAGDLAKLSIAAASGGERIGAAQERGHGLYYTESAKRMSYGQIGQQIGRSLRHKVTIPLPVPHFGIRLAGALADIVAHASGTPRYISTDKAREATAGSWICDASKAQRQLRCEYSGDLAQQFSATAHWYQEHGWL